MQTESSPVNVRQYYTTHDYFAARYAALARQYALTATTREEFAAWKQRLRARLGELLGLPTMVPCPRDVQLLERVPQDGYVREKVLLQTEPGVRMPCYVLIPDGVSGEARRPAVIAAHGHAGGGKEAVAGRTDLPVFAEEDCGIQLRLRRATGA